MRGLLGKTLSHSYSKIIHEKIDNKPYDLIERNELDSFFQEKGFTALNITIPYKQKVIQYCDHISMIVERTQACNTIINTNGVLYGYNTDYDGLQFLFEYNNIQVAGKRVAIIGNGSTSRTCQVLVHDLGAQEILIFARNPKQNELQISQIDQACFDILIHATPLGMYPKNDTGVQIDFSQHKELTSVVDLVYNPLKSKLLQQALMYGKKVVNGLIMLVHQAVKANELFNSVTHSKEITEKLYLDILSKVTNIVFIGMPMSGKTYISRQIASTLGKTMIDFDNEIEKDQNMSIPNIFKSKGEKTFRLIEKDICEKYAKRNNQAISTGGGIILNEQNIAYLKQNDIIIFLDVPLQELIQRNPKDRPLLQDQNNIEKLYHERIDLYRNYADITIEKRGFNAKNILTEIEVKLYEYINSQWS